jgi:predicted DNA-binding transcriptional regulator YafY
MSQRGTIKRYTAIIEKLESKQYPTALNIIEYLHELGFEISKRTFERDLDAIRSEFGIEITYNIYKKGYFIDKENSIDIASFIRFLEIVNTAYVLSDSLSDSKDVLNYIHFDQGGGFTGLKHLNIILQAIRFQKVIQFKHYSYQHKRESEYTINPYLLKEYQNRWYVVGWVDHLNTFRTFGLDRLIDVAVCSKTFEKDESINLIHQFNQTIGVVYGDGKTEKVVLFFTKNQSFYIKSLPLHPSQQIISEDEKGMIISLNVVPNYELIQLILMYNENVQIISPVWLIEEVKQRLQKTINRYT